MVRHYETLGLAANSLYVDKYLARVGLDAKSLRKVCTDASVKFANLHTGRVLSESETRLQRLLAAKLNDTCGKISPITLNFEFFAPIEESRALGCYDAFVRLEEIQDRQFALIKNLKNRIDSSGGGRYASLVRNELSNRIGSGEVFSQATNWWANQSSGKFCGFDMRVRIKYPRINESQFVSCVLREAQNARETGSDQADAVVRGCGQDLQALQ